MFLTKFVRQSSILRKWIVKKVCILYSLKFYPNFDALFCFAQLFFLPFYLKKNCIFFLFLNSMILKYLSYFGLAFLSGHNISEDNVTGLQVLPL